MKVMSEKIHEIHIQIDDDVFKRLKTEMGIRIMCDGSSGFSDQFVKKIITTIDSGEKEIRLVLSETDNSVA